MKLKATVSKLLTNKLVLNIVAVISLLNVIGYMMLGNINAVLYFIILALLVQYFSKNMIIILGIPLILVNLFALKSTKRMFEGMENNDSNKKTDATNKSKSKTDSEKHSETIKKINQQDAKSKQGLPITPLDNTHETTMNTSSSNAATDESFEVGRVKRGGGYNIDYASTVEDAYDQLNSILGSDGIKKLTEDTKGLMKQQLQLAESMQSMAPMIKSMAPLMKQAQGILGTMGSDNKDGLGNIMEMVKKLTGENK